MKRITFFSPCIGYVCVCVCVCAGGERERERRTQAQESVLRSLYKARIEGIDWNQRNARLAFIRTLNKLQFLDMIDSPSLPSIEAPTEDSIHPLLKRQKYWAHLSILSFPWYVLSTLHTRSRFLSIFKRFDESIVFRVETPRETFFFQKILDNISKFK